MKNWRVLLLSFIAAAFIAGTLGSAAGMLTVPDLSTLISQPRELGLQSSPQPSCMATPAAAQNCRIFTAMVQVSGDNVLHTELPDGIEVSGYKSRARTTWVIKLKETGTRATLVGVTDDAAGTQQREYPVWVERGTKVYFHFQLPNS